MAEYIVVSGGFHDMKEKKFQITNSEFEWLDGVRRNDAHGGKLVAADVYEMGGKIGEKVQKYLCGMKDCTCGGNGKAELVEE